MARFVMEFERPLAELEAKLTELKALDAAAELHLDQEIAELEAEVEQLRVTLYQALSPWERVQVSRHPERPKTQDYVEMLGSDVFELRGDRTYGDDEAIFAGLVTIAGRRCVVLGHRKGRNTKENIRRNFGSPHPEGLRKARRAMQLAEKFGLPLVTFVDTQGAHPGLEAEERGQGWAIAENLATLAALRVPVVAVGIGEGGSGGALAIGFGDRLIMLENAYYSVISPEACASILYKDASRAPETSACLQMTAADLVRHGIADEIVPEPLGGAHRDPGMVYAAVERAISSALDSLCGQEVGELVEKRFERISAIGVFTEGE
ncbi:MAG: acetyl-CoA carboxylase carboxyl transferase subunit alpha [Actinobacteria bacterium HGW-Actinobacteria-1]|jgi:acetyl-CoA carboxylase carboxyl transferase subunit alpha|nr:MAG: acetyl-CoA carboxylase carboxyl transferase subunit alpha [Actinobacteria bacterium HGW-Actinobacteria-1]